MLAGFRHIAMALNHQELTNTAVFDIPALTAAPFQSHLWEYRLCQSSASSKPDMAIDTELSATLLTLSGVGFHMSN